MFMLFAGKLTETKTFEDSGAEIAAAEPITPEPTQSDLLDLYDRIAHTKKTGTRDAQIFEAIREWTFSDFSVPPCKFAGVSAAELKAWQKRYSINLSAGHIRPAHIDIARGFAWGTVRRGDHVNGRHTLYGPPSREEMLEMMGSAG
jgi:hypothetical protein